MIENVYCKGGISVQSRNNPVDIGKELYTHVITPEEAMEKYHITKSTTHFYEILYKRSAGLTKRHPNEQKYKELKEDELRKELMRKDIEIERLKKGYAVKGVGANKEFVTIKDVNTK